MNTRSEEQRKAAKRLLAWAQRCHAEAEKMRTDAADAADGTANEGYAESARANVQLALEELEERARRLVSMHSEPEADARE